MSRRCRHTYGGSACRPDPSSGLQVWPGRAGQAPFTSVATAVPAVWANRPARDVNRAWTDLTASSARTAASFAFRLDPLARPAAANRPEEGEDPDTEPGDRRVTVKAFTFLPRPVAAPRPGEGAPGTASTANHRRPLASFRFPTIPPTLPDPVSRSFSRGSFLNS